MNKPQLLSYTDLNQKYGTNYSPRPFTEFEIALFNGKLDLTHWIENFGKDTDKVYSVNAYYLDVAPNSKEFLKSANMLLDFGDTRGHLRLGCYLDGKGKTQEATQIFKKGADLGNVICMLNYGSTMLKNEQFEEAIQYLQMAKDHGEHRSIVYLAYALCKQGKMVEALKCLYDGMIAGQADCVDQFCTNFLNCIGTEVQLLTFLLQIPSTNELIRAKQTKLMSRLTPENKEILAQYGSTPILLNINDKIYDAQFNLAFDLETDCTPEERDAINAMSEELDN